jgi:hypothetical protein
MGRNKRDPGVRRDHGLSLCLKIVLGSGVVRGRDDGAVYGDQTTGSFLLGLPAIWRWLLVAVSRDTSEQEGPARCRPFLHAYWKVTQAIIDES